MVNLHSLGRHWSRRGFAAARLHAATAADTEDPGLQPPVQRPDLDGG